MYRCQNWQCSAGDSPEPTAKKYKKTTYDKITNDGVQVENLDPTGLRKILLYVYEKNIFYFPNIVEAPLKGIKSRRNKKLGH